MKKSKIQENKPISSNVTFLHYTSGEIEALGLPHQSGVIPMTTNYKFSANDAGNVIIALAERIKAERSVAAMYV